MSHHKVHRLILLASLATFMMCCQVQQKQAEIPTQLEATKVETSIQPLKPDDESVRKAVEKFKVFAERFKPKATEEQTIPSLPELNTEMSEALEVLAASDTREHLKYMTLIILKLDHFYYEHFHQTYDLRGPFDSYESFMKIIKPTFLEEYCRLTQLCKAGQEMIPTWIAGDWVKKHPELLGYAPIKREIEQTDRIVEQYNKRMKAYFDKAERKKK